MKLEVVDVSQINVVVAPSSKAQQLSLLELEQINPIRLRPDGNGRYDIVDGRRRLVDLIKIGRETVQAIVEELTDAQLHSYALTLNSGTSNPMDEAEHIVYLIGLGHTQAEIAQMCNWSEAKVSQRVRLLDLIPEVKEQLRRGDTKVSAALILTKLDRKTQKVLAREGSVALRAAGEALREQQSSQLGLFDITVPDLGIKPGLFFTSEQMTLLADDKEVQVDWGGHFLTLKAVGLSLKSE